MTGDQEREEQRSVLGSARESLLSLTVLTAALYAGLRVSYSLFYWKLGAAPEDVGLGYTEILGQSAVSIGAFFIIAAILALILFLFGLLRRRIFALSLCTILLAGLGLYTYLAFSLADDVRRGTTVRATPWAGWRAQPAHVTWIGSRRQPIGLKLERRDSLMYLGSSSGISVFYDYDKDEIVRVPSTSVIVSLRRY